jgi:outer membrane protein assembly factor BamA
MLPAGVDAASAAPDTLRFRERRYRARLSPDLTQVGGVVGVDTGIGGASMLHFSDMLGNHNLAVGFGIYGSLKDSDFSLGYLNRSHRIHYEFSGFQHQRRYGYLGTDGTEKQTYRGVQFTLHRPFDKFSRLETSLQVAGVRGRFFLGQTPGEVVTDPGIQEMRTYVGGGMAYVQDTALFGITGPILGRRLRVSVDAGTGELDFVTLQADVRRYWSLSPELTLAGRGFVGFGAGPTAQSFYLGGSSTLRGYGYGALVGTHAALAGVELRFPLLRYIALGWPLPLEFGNVRGVLFVDAGSAWDGKLLQTSRATLGERIGRGPQVAGGLGMRVNLGSFVFRADWAQRYDTGTGTVTPGSSISIGADF